MDTTDTARGILDTLAELHLIELGAGCTAAPAELRPHGPNRHPETQARHDELRERLAALADKLHAYAVIGGSSPVPDAPIVARLIAPVWHDTGHETIDGEPRTIYVLDDGPRVDETLGPLAAELPADPPYRLDTFTPSPTDRHRGYVDSSTGHPE